jgi:glutamate-5-semialdehyde dehydrogenase
MAIFAEQSGTSIEPMLLYMGKLAREAARELALAPTDAKNAALERLAARLEARAGAILKANGNDIESAKGKGRDAAFIDRLMLNEARVAAMAKGLRDIALLADPVGQTTESWTRPNGLKIARVRVPLGVIGIIYESRPNVTADAAGLCLKSGNAVILRGGSESFLTSLVICNALTEALGAEREDAPDGHLRCGGDPARGPRSGAGASCPAREDADRGRLRGARR